MLLFQIQIVQCILIFLFLLNQHFFHLIKYLEYDTVYHEHLSYITVTPLILFFKKFNLEIIDVQQRDIHGGSIRIFISEIGNYKVKNTVRKISKMENKAKLNSKKVLINFHKKVIQNRIKLTSLLTKLKKMNKKIIALSAPAKGMVLLNYCKYEGDFIDYATAKSTIKHGLFTPGGNITVNSVDYDLRTPLHIAYSKKNTQIINLRKIFF